MSDRDDYARYVRNDDGTYDVIMAKSRKTLMSKLCLIEAARYVREHNQGLVEKRGY